MFESPTRNRKYLKIAIFGKSGTGKTRFALSFPAPAVIDTEKGTDPFIGKYEFKVKPVNRWKDLEPILTQVQKSPGDRHTLVIDSATIFYGDLINDLVEYVKKKRGNEILSPGDWGVEKRRWAAFLNILTFLPMHTILTFREKEEYIDVVDRQGNEVRKKSGDHFAEADRVTDYIFDLSFRAYTEENKKAKSSRFFVQCLKSRYDWMPKYSIHDVTGKNAFEMLFQKQVSAMMDLPTSESKIPSERLAVEDAEPVPSQKEVTREEEAPTSGGKPVGSPTISGNREALVFFGGGDPDAPSATAEDIKVLMTRCGQLEWPDGRSFSSSDGKKMIKHLFSLESTKDLKKYQADFLYDEFGKILSGKAKLALDEAGIPYVHSAE